MSETPQPDIEETGSSGAGFLAVFIAVALFAACLILAAGLIGAVVYAGMQRIKTAETLKDMEALHQQIEQLEAQVAEYQRRYSVSEQQMQAIEQQATKRADTPTIQFDTGGLSKLTVLFDDQTRVDPSPPITTPAVPFPEPETVGKRTGRFMNSGHIAPGVDRYELPYQAKPQRFHTNGGYSPLTFSEGFHRLFLVDGNTVLRSFNVNDLMEDRKLVLGTVCTEIAMSATGLVAALPNTGSVWAIDADTLAVRYEIELAGATRVAASPRLGLAFAVGETEAIAFNVRSGEVLYRQPLGNVKDYLNRNVYGFHITPDGKHAYIANRNAVHKFKVIDGVRMVYEGKTADINSSNTQMMSMSRDGNWVALSAGGGIRRGGYAIGLFNTDKLDTPSLILQTGAYPGCVEWDLKTGNIFANNHDELLVCNPRGHPIKTIARMRGNRCQQIISLPIGDRFIMWTEQNISIWDLQPGRLRELINGP
ncbi:MAG: hypothetical protein AAGB26_12995 [Planctomycetota bacterium]